MTDKQYSRTTPYFWTLIGVSMALFGMGVIFSWGNGQAWLQTLWHICQAQLQHLGTLQPLVWQLVFPAILLIMTVRGTVSLFQQIRATARLVRTFYPLRQAPPPRLRQLLAAHQVKADQVVFLNVPSSRAFCLGFIRPRIWLTAGLVELLSDAELDAVVAHEVHHRRMRDPLRLVVSRALRATFFFLPAVTDLAQAAELEQEIAADQSAIAHLKDDLPLLCALQKLMQQDQPLDAVGLSVAPETGLPYSPFNVTEARLRRLIYPPTPPNWRRYAVKWVYNLSIIAVLGSIIFFSVQPASANVEIITCTFEQSDTTQSHSPWLNYNSM